MVPVFKNVGEISTAKNYRPVSYLSVVSKVFERLVNNRIVDHPEKCGVFSDFQYGFRSSRSTDLLTVVSDKIARGFNRSWATRAVALDISKACERVSHTGVLLYKLKSYGISGQIFGLFLLFSVMDGFEWFWMESLHKNIHLMLEFLNAPFLVLHFSCYTLMTFLTMSFVILLSILMILVSILSVIKASDLWQQLEFASEPCGLG